jgi:orotidine-5'-phosphate decarboxylase
MQFAEKLRNCQDQHRSWLCIGLDPQIDKLPAAVQPHDEPLLPFCKAIIDATADLVCAYKPNLAFFMAQGAAGMIALERVMRYVPAHIPVILDAKLGDIGSTAEQYARAAFEAFGADAVTVQPFIGADCVRPFLQYADKGIFLLARTSNPGAGDFQDLMVDGAPLYQHVVARAREWHAAGPGACGLVVGATYPAELAVIRALAPDQPNRSPGVCAQCGDLAAAVQHGPTAQGLGPLINASRAVLYASRGADFAEAARRSAAAARRDQRTTGGKHVSTFSNAMRAELARACTRPAASNSARSRSSPADLARVHRPAPAGHAPGAARRVAQALGAARDLTFDRLAAIPTRACRSAWRSRLN